MSFTGKTAVVTGGSRGIGKAICLELARRGANVVFSYAGNTAAAEETLKELQDKLKFSDTEFQKLRLMYKPAAETTKKVLPSESPLTDVLKPNDELFLIQRGSANKMSSSHSNDSVKIYN